jgi:hypothetical protein
MKWALLFYKKASKKFKNDKFLFYLISKNKLIEKEVCPSGRRSWLGKLVISKQYSEVRILSLPPLIKNIMTFVPVVG